MRLQEILFHSDMYVAGILLGLLVLMFVFYAFFVSVPDKFVFKSLDQEEAVSNSIPLRVFSLVFSPITNFMRKKGVQAATLAVVSFLCALFSSVFFVLGLFGWGAVVAFGVVVSSRQMTLVSERTFSSIVNRYTDFLPLIGLAFFYRYNTLPLALVFGVMLGSFMMSYTTISAKALGVSSLPGNMLRVERWLYLLFGAGLSGLTIPLLEYRFLRMPWVGIPMVLVLGLVAILSNVSALKRLHHLYLNSDSD